MHYVPVNSYGDVVTVSSPINTFFLVNQCPVILSLVTDNNLCWVSGREENGHRNYFMINIREIMGPASKLLLYTKVFLNFT